MVKKRAVKRGACMRGKHPIVHLQSGIWNRQSQIEHRAIGPDCPISRLPDCRFDALGIPHENGLITVDSVGRPDPARLAAAVSRLRAAFPADAVELYLRTLPALDEDTWGALDVAEQTPR
jgi:hypothetical protein